MGAADYVVRPFSLTELAARDRAALRKWAASQPSKPHVRGNLAIDYAARGDPGWPSDPAGGNGVPPAGRARGQRRARVDLSQARTTLDTGSRAAAGLLPAPSTVHELRSGYAESCQTPGAGVVIDLFDQAARVQTVPRIYQMASKIFPVNVVFAGDDRSDIVQQGLVVHFAAVVEVGDEDTVHQSGQVHLVVRHGFSCCDLWATTVGIER